MAEAVVDALEIVDVHQQQANGGIAVASEAFVEVAYEGRPVAQGREVVGVGQALDALLGEFGLGNIFVYTDVVRQLAVVAIDLGNRQLAPVRFQVLASALEFTLPAVAFGQGRRRVEQQFAEVFQGRQLRKPLAMDFFGAVLGNGGEAGVDVLDHAVAVDQQEGVGALFHCPLEQMQGAGGSASVVVVDDLGELVGQFTCERNFVRLPRAAVAGLLKAQHADYLAIDADAGVEHGVDVARSQAFGHFPGAWVAHGVIGIDCPAGVQGIEVARKKTGIDRSWQEVLLASAIERRDWFQALAFQVPDARAVDFIDFARAAGNQLRSLEQGVIGAVALPGQAQDQILLRANSVKVLQLHLLGLLIELKSNMQGAFRIFGKKRVAFCFDDQ
ncbi:hypothetical protein D3C80_845250 [compost metagenome]